MKLAEKITMIRKRAGLSQEELAEKLKVSRQAVSRWEQGVAVLDTNNIVQLARLFGVTTDFLLLDEQDETAQMPDSKKEIGRCAGKKITAYIMVGFSALGILTMGVVGSVAYLGQSYSYQKGFEIFVRFPLFLER